MGSPWCFYGSAAVTQKDSTFISNHLQERNGIFRISGFAQKSTLAGFEENTDF